MAHFAKVLDKTVIDVIVAEPEFFDVFIDNSPGKWIQCSYNTRGGKHYSDITNNILSENQSKALRKNFPGIGYNYDSDEDAFYAPKPFDSWVLNKTSYLWEAPIPYPDDGKVYDWNEETQSWDPVTES